MSWSVLWKDWCANLRWVHSEGSYNYSMTISALSFLLYLLKCWSFCNRSSFKHHFLLENLIAVFSQGHDKDSKCQWMYVQMIFSELLNLFFPNLIWWGIIMSQSSEKICLVSSGQGHSEDSYNQYMTFYYFFWIYYFFWTRDPFAAKLTLTVHHHKPVCHVKRLDCYYQGHSHSKG